jgi:hypothetical protein
MKGLCIAPVHIHADYQLEFNVHIDSDGLGVRLQLSIVSDILLPAW